MEIVHYYLLLAAQEKEAQSFPNEIRRTASVLVISMNISKMPRNTKERPLPFRSY